MKIQYNLTLDDILSATDGKLIIAGDGTGPLVFNEIFTDSRDDFGRNAIFIALKGKNFKGEDFVEAVFKKGGYCALVSWDFLENNDISKYGDKIIIATSDPVSSLGDIAKLYLSKFNLKKKIALTGSCGKTTTKEIVYAIFSTVFGAEKILKNDYNYNNLIGVPKAILRLNDKVDYLILEIGTNKKGEIKRLSEIISPDIGAITNIGKSHLEEFKNTEGVFMEKSELALSLKNAGFLVLNADDAIPPAKYKDKIKEGVDIVSFGFGKLNAQNVQNAQSSQSDGIPDVLCESAVSNEKTGKTTLNVLFKGKKYVIEVNFSGKHLIYDFLCAFSIASACGIAPETYINSDAFKNFIIPHGRMEIIRITDDTGEWTLINDAYNSNPDSLKAALDFIRTDYSQNKKILVLGDMLELGDSAPEEHVKAGREISGLADFIFYKGDYSDFITKGLEEKKFSGNFFLIKDDETFKNDFKKLDKNNAVVLLKGSRGMKLEEYFKEETNKKVESSVC
ncbi:MAG: UDP-N-acetylmuramoyl-tripeptide--D-alanyl-D-alanine ligase [Candidatus Acidulodesulfobacterium acidiphilum]|uniref:UDP-N-acetylmuramoyl-tripeptide--D-alanyl-D-alanine ligase n=1 Tax=Candidatus Acidulodesulfobacterium acidiphilum TaxID=2597224 RepID=A0A520XBY7_9DELT|nr:MAG: UDP-N-acetylmuramoyl-tripeptide--D-alanyl-D-alanine ligase [Candidatus Acidulodesulfobacterium acidiphilum]